MAEPRKYCPQVCGSDTATGEYVTFCPSTDDRRACTVYLCQVCGEFFALNYDAEFCEVPDEAVAS